MKHGMLKSPTIRQMAQWRRDSSSFCVMQFLAHPGPNTQPWKFAVHESSISVFADLSRTLPFVDPSNRTLFMSVGCAIANLTVAGKHFGFAPSVSYFPGGQDSDLVAVVQLSASQKTVDGQDDLFAQIQRRHTAKDRYENATIKAAQLEDIEWNINLPGIYLTYLGDVWLRPGKSAAQSNLLRHKSIILQPAYRRAYSSRGAE